MRGGGRHGTRGADEGACVPVRTPRVVCQPGLSVFIDVAGSARAFLIEWTRLPSRVAWGRQAVSVAGLASGRVQGVVLGDGDGVDGSREAGSTVFDDKGFHAKDGRDTLCLP
jgi:hypothetical protein